MEELSSQSRQHWEQPSFGSHENSSLTRRRGAIINTLSVKNDIQLLHSGSQFIDVILDAPGSDEIERCCHFSDGEILKTVLTNVTEDYGVDLSQCQVVLLSQPDMSLDFNSPANDYSSQTFLIISSSRHLSVVLRPVTECPTRLSTVDDCITYFTCYGLKPLDGTASESSSSSPRLASLCFNRWEDILDQETIEDFTEEEEDQQEAIWELIYTEHSHLSQLGVVIDVFMKCLEYIQSIDLLTEVNYHNIFGHMRDLYEAHQNFWDVTLLPCLQKAADGNRPLDVNDLIAHFPEQFSHLFEPYEHHCIFELQNLQALDDAMNNADFNAYIKLSIQLPKLKSEVVNVLNKIEDKRIKVAINCHSCQQWCEARAECKRLRLKDFLAKPMQRLTKYPLLLKAILSKTSAHDSRIKLQSIISTVNDFVGKINSTLRYQDEVEKVKVVSQRLATKCVYRDVPSGWEKYLQPYLHLDLLAPMAGVNLQQPRTLIMEGVLRYKEDTIKLDVNAFLFTDMLLITRASKKSPDQLVIVKTPYKIDSLIVKLGKDPMVIDLVSLNDLKLVGTIFSLKATTPQMASSWLESIQQAQQAYYRLRCNYETQYQYQQQKSPEIWSAMSQSEINHIKSLSEPDHFSPSRSLIFEPITIIDRNDSCKRNSKYRQSSSISPPIFSNTAEDTSTPTDNTVAVFSDKEMSVKKRFFVGTHVKRYASYEGLERSSIQRMDEKTLLAGTTDTDNSTVRRHKRSKSLKTDQNKK